MMFSKSTQSFKKFKTKTKSRKGEWKNGERHGKGTFYYTNGDKYIGDWVKDVQHGKGIYAKAHSDVSAKASGNQNRRRI